MFVLPKLNSSIPSISISPSFFTNSTILLRSFWISADIQKDLNRIVEFVKKLGEIDIDGIDEFNFGKTNIEDMRKDSVTIYDNTDDILKNTKNKNQDFFTVPKIVE